MAVITLDAQVRMAQHLRKCGWKVEPPKKHARRHVMEERLGIPSTAAPVQDVFDMLSAAERNAYVESYLSSQANRRAGSKKRQTKVRPHSINHRLLLAFAQHGPMSTKEVTLTAGLARRQSGRINELLQWKLIEVAVQSKKERIYRLTERGLKALEELRNE
jgi:predicted transcriptional regulator